MSRTLLIVSAFAVAFGLACAGPVAVADEPIDWQAADDHWSVHIVTKDADGDERVARIWLATTGRFGLIRTGDSRWWANLERDPNCSIRMDGTDYPVHGEAVTELPNKALIDDLFLEKYGWQERAFIFGERGETHEHYMRLRAAAPSAAER